MVLRRMPLRWGASAPRPPIPPARAPRTTLAPPPLPLRLVAVLVVPLALYALYATGQKASEHYRLAQQAEALRTEVRGLRSENLRLQEQLHDARTDAAIEAVARQELGLVRPGDRALVLLPSGQRAASGAASPAPAPPPPPAWQQWWDHFFGPAPGP